MQARCGLCVVRESLERRREEAKCRWERLEARRRARMQYYHAKIHHERSQQPVANDEEDTPLHKACQRGRFDFVSLLLQHGAGIDIQDKEGNTPLILARQHVDIAFTLLRHSGQYPW